MQEFLEKIRKEKQEFLDRINENGYTCKEVKLGRYSNSPIEWFIIHEDEKSLLLLSRYIIDLLPCCENNFERLPWEASHMRKWLNEVFFYQAFNKEEKKLIIEGVSTYKDKVFLLSKSEVDLYLKNKYRKEILAEMTDNAIEQFEYKRKYIPGNGEIVYSNFYKKPYMSWWLRDYGKYHCFRSGSVQDYKYCTPDGDFSSNNSYYEYCMGAEFTFDLGIRPAIYVDKSSFSNMRGK